MKKVRLPFLIALAIFTAGGSAYVQGQPGEQEYAAIAILHERGWQERSKGNFKAGEDLFRKAQQKLKNYRKKYEKDEASISFLRTTYRLGYLSELAGKHKEARAFYLECLANPSIKSDAARADGAPISQLAANRLEALDRPLPANKKASTENFPRIRVSGGSKGNERELPPRSSDKWP